MNHSFAITFDVDWAPDFVIDRVASVLIEHQVKATWFITHDSPALHRLKAHSDLFELGLHPNFLPHSTQGDSPDDILTNLQKIVPEARSARTHALVQSWPLLQEMVNCTAINVDASIFLPEMPHIQPVAYNMGQKKLLRVPFFWGDDYELAKASPQWQLKPYVKVEGLKVMNFHPIHVYLNASSPDLYRDLKQSIPQLNQLTPENAQAFIHPGKGPLTFLEELAIHLKGESYTLQEICAAWEKG